MCPGEDQPLVNSLLGDHTQCLRYSKVYGVFFRLHQVRWISAHPDPRKSHFSILWKDSVKARKEVQVNRFHFSQSNGQPCVLQSRQFTSDEQNQFVSRWTRPIQTSRQNLSPDLSESKNGSAVYDIKVIDSLPREDGPLLTASLHPEIRAADHNCSCLYLSEYWRWTER